MRASVCATVWVGLVGHAAADEGADWRADRHGLVVEANAGAGILHHGPWGLVLSIFSQSDTVARFETPMFGGGLGLGGWIDPRVALTGRVSSRWFRSSQVDEPSDRRTFLNAFVGPELQYWLPPLHGAVTDAPALWLAGGMGVSVLAASGYSNVGLGLDARAGYSIGSFQLSIEATDGIFDTKFNVITIALMLGLQNL